MNILPKKRWHVRTKDNIARVRRDEAAARIEDEIKLKKLKYAESEVRINYLRDKSRVSSTTNSNETSESITTTSHVDLFSDYQSHVKVTNKDLVKEKKEEREKYEKQIGYLTYLGQDTNEALKLRSWYEIAPHRSLVGDKEVVEKDTKNKHAHDPLTLINALLPPEKNDKTPNAKKIEISVPTGSRLEISKQSPKHKSKKHKKEKKHKRNKHKKGRSKKEKLIKSETTISTEVQSKKENLEKLRRERLRREAKERTRQKELLMPKMVPSASNVGNNSKTSTASRIIQKYNSQFNPEFAKQNMN